MILSLPDFMANCPPKLLKLYPDFIRRMTARIKARETGVKPQFLPRAPMLVITGSRYGGNHSLQYVLALEQLQTDMLKV